MALELDRRRVLVALAACGVTAACRPIAPPVPVRPRPRPTTTLPPTTSTTVPAGPPAGLALARRFSFGPTPDLIAAAAGGADAFVDAQLDPRRAEHPATAALVVAIDAEWAAASAAAASDDPAAVQARRRAATTAAVSRSVVLSAWSNLQLRQVAADFFADHLHVSIAEQPTVFFVPEYDDQVIRAGALGRFADLLVASARSSAMLVYLDNARSRADRGRVPNENYARELLELHAVGVAGGYDETDVVEVAHVLSGWSLDPSTREFTFRSAWHDLGPAESGEILGWRPSGRGVADGESFLNHLARLPATARFLCWKLARRFVSDTIAPDDPLVADLSATYLREDTAIAPVLRLAARRSDRWGPKVRRPLDLVAAALRTGGPVPTAGQFRASAGQLHATLDTLGQVPWKWPAPNGFPESAGAWSGAGAMIARWNAATSAASGFGGLPVHPAPTPQALLGHAPGPALAAAVRTARTPDVVRALTFASPEFQLR
jgi:uncharacterized protein (DUF1800 family)